MDMGLVQPLVGWTGLGLLRFSWVGLCCVSFTDPLSLYVFNDGIEFFLWI